MSDITDDVRQQIATLRADGLTPKSIAKRLALRPAEVSTIIRQQAEALAKNDLPLGMKLLVACQVSEGWKVGLGLDPIAKAWPDPQEGSSGRDGLVTVLVAREFHHDKVRVSTFLVDVFCLGVKNAIPPKTMSRDELTDFIQKVSRMNGTVDAPIGLAQNVVLGAVDYARRLGFEPHADFNRARELLGEWDGTSHIQFGRDGKPVFINGPDDDVWRVLATLRRTVGEGNFDSVIMSGPMG
jgi:hypothetical protein